jgi:putative selenium metabolism protein SsnA
LEKPMENEQEYLVTNATLVTWEKPNRILENHSLYVDNGIITAIGPTTELERDYPLIDRMDAKGQLVMPGNICTHTHFYGAFARGMAIPGLPPKDFTEILEKLWWSLDKCLTLEDVCLSALVMLVDAIRHGTTTLIDHHASPNAIEGSLDVIAAAVEEAGVRAVLCYEVSDRDGPEKTRQGIEENLRFIQRTRRENVADGRVQATFGMHASLTLSDATLDACREIAPDDVGFHLHAAEGAADQYDSIQKSGLRVVERLHRHGILGPHSILAHAVHVDAHEINLLGESGSWVTHQPRSNMNNAVGAAPVESLLNAGVKVGLGTDGFSSTMWQEGKIAYLLQKSWQRDPRSMSGVEVINMLFYNNARLVENIFKGSQIGSLATGAVADIIFVDYHPPTPMDPDNLPWHILFGFQESMISTTIAAGKVLMRDHQILVLDEAEISVKARQLAASLWSRYHQLAL